MRAKDLYFGKEINVYEADDVIKSKFPEAEYYAILDDHTLILESTDISIYQIEEGSKYYHYIIGGKIYRSFFTNRYEELLKIKPLLEMEIDESVIDEEKDYEQMTLFDYIGGK